MGMASEYSLVAAENEVDFDFSAEYLSRYPGLCTNCGSRVCMCPPVPQATIGRMAKEMPLDLAAIQIQDQSEFAVQGERAALEVFERVGIDAQIGRHLPYDRGDLNTALVHFCFRVANAVEQTDAGLAGRLREHALRISTSRSERGTSASQGDPVELIATLREAWVGMGVQAQDELRESGGEVSELTHLFEKTCPRRHG